MIGRQAAVLVLSLAATGAGASDVVTACAEAADPWARIEACTTALASGQWPGAAGAWAYSNRAVAHASLGQYQQAFDDHNQAVALDPAQPRVLNNRGNSHADFREWARAIADYTRAIGLDPAYTTAYYNRAGARLALGDAAGARADYDKVLALQPDFAAVLADRAVAACAMGDVAASIADRRAALAAGVLDPAALDADLAAKGYGSRPDPLAAWTAAGCP